MPIFLKPEGAMVVKRAYFGLRKKGMSRVNPLMSTVNGFMVIVNE